MNTEFNEWWNEDLLTEDNPFVENTAAYWAWEGWCAAVKIEREACAKVCDELAVPPHVTPEDAFIWEAGTLDCSESIRARSNK